MRGTQTKRWLSLIAVVAVMAMIFLFSAQEGDDSAKLSDGVTEWVLAAVVPGYRGLSRFRKLQYLRRTGLLVRKAAHFSEYALLGAMLSVHLHYVLAGRRLRRVALASWLAATLYAATDELHQMFVGGRGPSGADVRIDSAGALAGALVGVAVILIWHKIKEKRHHLA